MNDLVLGVPDDEDRTRRDANDLFRDAPKQQVTDTAPASRADDDQVRRQLVRECDNGMCRSGCRHDDRLGVQIAMVVL